MEYIIAFALLLMVVGLYLTIAESKKRKREKPTASPLIQTPSTSSSRSNTRKSGAYKSTSRRYRRDDLHDRDDDFPSVTSSVTVSSTTSYEPTSYGSDSSSCSSSGDDD